MRAKSLVIVLALLAAWFAVPAGAAGPPPVELQILAINDFHGAIAPVPDQVWPTGPDPDGSGPLLAPTAPVGRADFFASHIREAEEGVRNSVVVSAGDLIGASPLISALFHDEPTIEAMNLIGLDIAGVGNHEFDEGAAELLRMQEGGCHPIDGCLDGDGFAGADFQYLSANVTVDATGETLFPPYVIENYQGVKVAFIGMTLEGTPTIVTPSGVAGLTFEDEVETVNALIPELQKKQVEAIVVLLHEGGFSSGGLQGDECGGGLSDPLASIVTGFNDAVDLVIAGHVNDEFVCEVDGKWVTMADNNGRLYTDIDVTLDRRTKEMTVVRIDNVPTFQSEVEPAPDLTALIDKYNELSAPLANQVIGSITADIPEIYNAAGEAAVGDVIADAQLAATTDPATGGAVVAFMNPGGIRTSDGFIFAGSPVGEGDGNVTFGEAFAVQPFGNSLVTMTLTGTQIEALLEQQFRVNPDAGDPGQPPFLSTILQVSEGFTYSWSASAPIGSKVDPASIMIGGTPIVLGDSYRVTVNSFLADGGDGFSVLVGGTDRLGGDIDLDALVAYFGANSPVAPGPQDRITQIA
jgi:5'-nucleotidase